MSINDPITYEGTNGKAVLLLHGLTSGAGQMRPMAQYLNGYGYTVRCVNLAGHGTYPEDLLHTTAEDMIAKAEYDLAELQAEYAQVFVGGVSTGGLLSLLLASRHPELAGIVPISSPLWLVPTCFLAEAFPEEQVWMDRPLGIKPGLFRKYHVHYEKIAICIIRQLERLMEQLQDPALLGSIRCPVLLVQAEDDDVAEPASADYFAQYLPADTLQLLRLKSGGHLCLLNEGCYALFASIRDFLDSCGAEE